MTNPLNWRDAALAVALAMLAIVVVLPDDWPIWSTNAVLAGIGVLVMLAILADMHDRNTERWTKAKSRVTDGLRRLRHLGFRSPLFIKRPAHTATIDAGKAIGFADIAPSLEEYLRETERRFKQHVDVMQYGNPIFRDLPPLSRLEMEFYQTGVKELLPFVKEAGKAMRAFLMSVLHKMWAYPEEDPRYWLAHFLNTELYNRLTATLERFESQAQKGADSREALAAFYYQYERSLRAIGRIDGFLEKKVATLPGSGSV